MASYRRGRINEKLTREIADILRSVKDPRVQRYFISITGVDCTADLRSAKVYYSAVGKNVDQEAIRQGLKSAMGYIRGQIAQRLNLRITPELTFIYDTSMERGVEMASLLRSIDIPEEDEEAEEHE